MKQSEIRDFRAPVSLDSAMLHRGYAGFGSAQEERAGSVARRRRARPGPAENTRRS